MSTDDQTIKLESDAIVVLIGAMGTGKSTFCDRYFDSHDIVSSDDIREQMVGNFEDQSVNRPVFKVLFSVLDARAEHGLFTVVDSTGSRNLLEKARSISEQYARPLYAFIFPHLTEDEITRERMKHRMNYIDAYYRQVERINKTDLPKRYKPVIIPKRGRFNLKIEYTGKQQHILDSDYRYVIIPDIHGEFRVLENYEAMYPEDDTRIIQLGDIVDRGESSYQSFLIAKRMVDEGKMAMIRSNHDDKLARYFQKWLAHESTHDKYQPVHQTDRIPTYGMKISYGLEKTLIEFYSLDEPDMKWYARNFVDFYYSLPAYLMLEREKDVHFFAHAGISRNLIMGREPKKSDYSHVIYNTIKDVEELEEIADDLFDDKDEVWLHVGHEFVDTEYLVQNRGRYYIVKHDVGFGKYRASETSPPMMVLEKEQKKKVA